MTSTREINEAREALLNIVNRIGVAMDAARYRGWKRVNVAIIGADGERHLVSTKVSAKRETIERFANTVFEKTLQVKHPAQIDPMPAPG